MIKFILVNVRLFSLTALLVLLITSCRETDIRLVNEIKTFDPQWITLGEKFAYVDRNHTILETRYRKDIAELKNAAAQIDSSTQAYVDSLEEVYNSGSKLLQNVQEDYLKEKKKYQEAVTEFNEWQQQVMKGEVDSRAGNAKLSEYKARYGAMDAETDRMRNELGKAAEVHNVTLAKIAERLGILANYNLELK